MGTCGSCRPLLGTPLIVLAGRVPILSGADVLTFVDIDSMLRCVYGRIATTRDRPRPHDDHIDAVTVPSQDSRDITAEGRKLWRLVRYRPGSPED